MTKPLPTNPTQLDFALFRLTEMQETVMPGSDAVPVWFYKQGRGPFWVNRVGDFSVELSSEEIQTTTYVITMRLVLNPVTSGIESEAERAIHTWLPTVIQYFGERRQLKRTNSDTGLDYLDPRGAVITGGRADYDMQVSGVGANLFGIDFRIEVPMLQYTDQLVF